MELLEFYAEHKDALEIIGDEEAVFLLAFVNELESERLSTSLKMLSDHLGWPHREIKTILQKLLAAGCIWRPYHWGRYGDIFISPRGRHVLRLVGFLKHPIQQAAVSTIVDEFGAPSPVVSPRRHIGIYLGDHFKKNPFLDHSPFAFRTFVLDYAALLASYDLLVTEETALSLGAIVDDLKKSHGIDLEWNLEVYGSARQLTNALIAKKDVERILAFLDPDMIDSELGRIHILADAAAQRNQKLNMNLGVHEWAEKEFRSRFGGKGKSPIGPHDAIVLAEDTPDLAIEAFAVKHLETVIAFPRFILPRRIASDLNTFSKLIAPQVDVPGTSLEVASAFIRNSFDTSRGEVEGKCHLIAFPSYPNEQSPRANFKDLIEICADPSMRVNPLLNEATAEEWIGQLEIGEPL